MKKKISLVLLCGVILLSVCGCGKKDLTGTYKISVSTTSYGQQDTLEKKGTLKLFDNGSCTLKVEKLLNGTHTEYDGIVEYNDCLYDIIDKTITIRYRFNEVGTSTTAGNYNSSECTIDGKNLNCEEIGNIEPYHNEVWEKQ